LIDLVADVEKEMDDEETMNWWTIRG